MLRASMLAEEAGVPSVSIITTHFAPLAEVVIRSKGFDDWPIAYYPGVIMTASREELETTVDDTLVDAVLAALMRSPRTAGHALEPGPRETVCHGDLDVILERFTRAGWTDGLPVVPPTLDRVERFLDHTALDADHVLGVLPSEQRAATVWSVAVNGVMAGCRPEYMPVLVSIVEAFAEPAFDFADCGSTPGWEPLVILSGPMVARLDLNSSTGVLRPGRQSNTSIGRFARLYMRNVGGWRIPPFETDKGTIGMPMNVALAENGPAARAAGWPTFSEEKGYEPDDDVTTVVSVAGISPPIYTAGDGAERHAARLADVFGERMCAYWSLTGYRFETYSPFLVLSPSVAAVFGACGWSKARLREYLGANAWIPYELMKEYAYDVGITRWTVSAALYDALVDERGRVPVFPYPEQIGVVVAGDPGRNQSRGYLQNHKQAPPTSKLVTFSR